MLFFNEKQKGFTLIELLVVVTIIGILSTIVLVSLNDARMKARDVRRLADLRQVALALELYYDDHTDTGYPGSSGSNQWTPCGGSNALENALETDYITSVPCDPGINSYEYWVAPDKNGYVLKATLENSDNPALYDDVDNPDGGTVLGCDCDDPEYCLEM
jgi:prepilin-type N-terminal cleavage/methylation domain-containing protein